MSGVVGDNSGIFVRRYKTLSPDDEVVCVDSSGRLFRGGLSANVLAFQHEYVFVQNIPSEVWVINHGLGRHPAVAVVDSSGRVVQGDIIYVSDDVVRLEFSGKFSGKAYLS